MIAPLKPGVTLARITDPVVETARLLLRPWRNEDIAPNTAMLGDPLSGRFITADNKPVTDAWMGWRNAALIAGHWALHGIGMFVVEEKQTGRFAGRVGPWKPPGWSGFEVGWGIASDFRGKGYAGGGRARRDRLVVCDLRNRSHLALHRPRERGFAIRGAEARRTKGSRDRSVRPCCGSLGNRAPHIGRPI
jgi:hypothetical protein